MHRSLPRSFEDLCCPEPTGRDCVGKQWGLEWLYHVLHGVSAPLDGVGPEDLKIRELLARSPGEVPIEEVVIATGASVEGEATAIYLAWISQPDRSGDPSRSRSSCRGRS